jgi:hypothetical protein
MTDRLSLLPAVFTSTCTPKSVLRWLVIGRPTSWLYKSVVKNVTIVVTSLPAPYSSYYRESLGNADMVLV